MATLTKADLIKAVSVKVGLNQQVARQLVEAFFSEIELLLSSGYDLKLSGFGNFVLHDKKTRQGRNPKTGEVFEISARRVVAFKAGQKLKKIIN